MPWTGVIPAVVTPFNSAGELEPRLLEGVIEYLLEAGCSGLFVAGTRGEAITLSAEERATVLRTTVARTAGAVPIFFGIGAASTRETLQYAAMGAEYGADVLVVVEPYFFQYSQEELQAHYATIAEGATRPVMAYHLPQLTGNSLAPQTLARLALHRNLVGVKDSGPDLLNTRAYLEQTPDDFTVLVGNDVAIPAALLMGAHGIISGPANILPQLYVALFEACRKGNLAEQQRLYGLELELLQALTGYGSQSATTKEAMRSLGIEAGLARRPSLPSSPENQARLAQCALDLERRLAGN